MSSPFLYELGVSKVLFADISKLYGVFLMVIGALLGGLVMRFLGDVYGVLLALVLQMMSSLMFTLQTIIGFHIPSLIISVGVESLTSGLVSAIFIAYISKFCKTPHTASHFTLLYSFGSLSRVLLSSLSAYLADIMQWGTLFFSMSFVAIPAILLLLVLEDKISIRLSAIFDSKAA
jgi:PAT family beta-lactamase induction signal transducer AmpG